MSRSRSDASTPRRRPSRARCAPPTTRRLVRERAGRGIRHHPAAARHRRVAPLGRGVSSRRCARRSCCCCCWRSPPCPARSCRSAAPTRTASRSTSPTTPRLAPVLDKLSLFDVYSLAVVLGDLHPAVRLAHRLRHPAHATPLEGAARAAAAHARAPRAPRRAPRVDRRADSRDGCRRPPADRRDRARPDQLQQGRLPRRAVRLGRDAVGLGRARLPARDRQPRLPRRARRACSSRSALGGGFTYTGQSVIIEGRTFVNTMLDYASFNPGSLRRRGEADAVLADARRVRGDVPAVGHDRRGQGRRLRRPPHHADRGARRRRTARCASTTRSTWPATASI